MASLDLLIIAAYMVGMVAVGFWTQRKATNQEEFLVAGRSVGPLLYSGTLAAVIISGGGSDAGINISYSYFIKIIFLLIINMRRLLLLGLGRVAALLDV